MNETKHLGPAYLPGDPTPRQRLDQIIRVDQAGEFGAVRIYAGQKAVLHHGPEAEAVHEMAEQEKEHLESFDRIITAESPSNRSQPIMACRRIRFRRNHGGNWSKGCDGLHSCRRRGHR